MKHFTKILVALAIVSSTILVPFQANAVSVSPSAEEIPNRSYVIGNYLFTRETNTETDYHGYVSTAMLMLAAKTIPGDTAADMIVYYKNAHGNWVDGISGEAVSLPENFEILYKNLGSFEGSTAADANEEPANSEPESEDSENVEPGDEEPSNNSSETNDRSESNDSNTNEEQNNQNQNDNQTNEEESDFNFD